MRPPPTEHVDPRAVLLWRIRGLGIALIITAFLAIPGVALAEVSGTGVVVAGGLIVFLVLALGFVVLGPGYLARSWRYEINRDELYLQRGIFVVRRTVVPLVRIENVDTVQGPLSARFGIMAVTVSTAAGTHEIPALAEETAESLRDRIAHWAREARDD